MRKLTFFFFLTILSAPLMLAQNYKIRQTISMNGMQSESTVYVKGLRKRTEGGGFMGFGGDVATVEQCDLKRYIKISDKKKMYAIEPFADESDATPSTTTRPVVRPKPTATPTPEPLTKGGVVTITSSTIDTGERQQMFGITARRVKTSMKMEASPDACMKGNMQVETDGWYIDLPEFSCPVTLRPQVPQMPSAGRPGGCRDRMITKFSGGGRLGFPLKETRTIISGNSGTSFSQTTDTIEFSRATLDAALFDIPQGYALTENASDLASPPDYAAMIKGAARNEENDEPRNNGVNPKRVIEKVIGEKNPGMIRIGVYAPTNRSEENVSTSNLQAFLIRKLTSGNVEAVAIASEQEARSLNCDYVVSSDFSKLKQSTASKIGGVFGRVTNTDTSASRNYEAQVDFKVISLKDGKTVSQSKANTKGESNADRAAENVLSQEAVVILSVAK